MTHCGSIEKGCNIVSVVTSKHLASSLPDQGCCSGPENTIPAPLRTPAKSKDARIRIPLDHESIYIASAWRPILFSFLLCYCQSLFKFFAFSKFKFISPFKLPTFRRYIQRSRWAGYIISEKQSSLCPSS